MFTTCLCKIHARKQLLLIIIIYQLVNNLLSMTNHISYEAKDRLLNAGMKNR